MAKALVGRIARIPFVERDVPIIADTMVEREFGTGAVKVTPAHDHTDFETGERHGLARIDIMNDDGSLDITDPIYLLGHLFEGKAKPAEPFARCGQDPMPDALGCHEFAPCDF